MNQENNYNQNNNLSVSNNQNLNNQNINQINNMSQPLTFQMQNSSNNAVENTQNNNITPGTLHPNNAIENTQNNNITPGTLHPNNAVDNTQNNNITPGTLHPNNDNGNLNNNKKSNKKGIIIGCIIVVIISIIATILILLLLGKKQNNSQKNNLNNNIVKENIELIYSGYHRVETSVYKYGYNFFELYKETSKNDYKMYNAILLDNKGKEILTLDNYTIKSNEQLYMYYGDNYIIYTNYEKDGVKVYDLEKKKNIFSNDECYYGYSKYKNGILYCQIIKSPNDKIIAYDLKKNKELWTAEATLNNNSYYNNSYGIFENGIRVSAGNYISLHNKNSYPSSLIDYNGKFIVKGNTDEAKDDRFYNEKNLTYTYITASNYYIKTKYNEYVSVYDLNNKLISTVSLEPSNGKSYSFSNYFDNGWFVIAEKDESGLPKSHTIYDVNKKVIHKTEGMIAPKQELSLLKNSVDEFDIIIVNVDDDYLIIKGNEVIEFVSDYWLEKYCDVLNTYVDDINNYIVFKQKDENTGKIVSKMMNLKTLKIAESSVGDLSKLFYESSNGNYLIVSTDYDMFVFDSEFNLKYESEFNLKPINDKFVLETDDEENLYLVNIENNNRKKLDVTGEYVEHNSGGLITKDENDKYYLYKFI